MDPYPLARSDLLQDAVLGPVTRDAGRKHWLFHLLLPNGRLVPGVIVPEHDDAPPSQQALDQAGERARWLRDNEPAVRDHITKKMYNLWLRGWHDEQVDPVTRDQFRERIWLASLTFLDDRRLTLHYNDAQLFGGQPLVQTINARGKLAGAPYLGG